MRKVTKRSLLGYNANAVHQVFLLIQKQHAEKKEQLEKGPSTLNINKSVEDFTKDLKVSLFGIHKSSVHRQLATLLKLQKNELVAMIPTGLERQIEPLELKEAEELPISTEKIAYTESNVIPFKKKEFIQAKDEIQTTADGQAFNEYIKPIETPTLMVTKNEEIELNDTVDEVTEIDVIEVEAPEIEKIQEPPFEQHESHLKAASANLNKIDVKAVSTHAMPSQMVVGLGFWGDIERFMEWQPIQLSQATQFQAIPLNVRETAATSTIGNLNIVDTPATPSQNRSIEEEHLPHIKSPALSEEILSIRERYIVGKRAGEDLIDRYGQIIVAKHSLITAQIVQKAEEEGKLAELIVHMLIPGLGE